VLAGVESAEHHRVRGWCRAAGDQQVLRIDAVHRDARDDSLPPGGAPVAFRASGGDRRDRLSGHRDPESMLTRRAGLREGQHPADEHHPATHFL